MVAFISLSFPWWFMWAYFTVFPGLPVWALFNVLLFWRRNWVTCAAWVLFGLNGLVLAMAILFDGPSGFGFVVLFTSVGLLTGGYYLRPRPKPPVPAKGQH